jgi:hypothetical protein
LEQWWHDRLVHESNADRILFAVHSNADPGWKVRFLHMQMDQIKGNFWTELNCSFFGVDDRGYFLRELTYLMAPMLRTS